MNPELELAISRLVERIDSRRHLAKPWKKYKRARSKETMRVLRGQRREQAHAA